MKYIDLNADLGEGYKNDRQILKYVSSANIACGLHAGSPLIMTDTVRLCISNNVSVGAHPGYPDRENFGRKHMEFGFHELKSILLYQIGALYAIVKSEGSEMVHVKAHGALYNSAGKDENIARAIVQASREVDPGLIIFGPSGSKTEVEAKRENMAFSSEVFADRAYLSDGSLVPRTNPSAIIRDKEICSGRTIDMINNGFIQSLDGKKVKIVADTVCLHGDNDGALDFARHLSETLINNGINIRAKRKTY
jgi:UPF0271 protein